MYKLSPSILSADFSQLGKQVALIEKGGADLIHVDVMDGHFVPNISFGAAVMKSVRESTNLNFDVHLMIEEPDLYIDDFLTDKTEYITVHQEACRHLHRTIGHIKSLGIKAGVSLNPATPIETLTEIISDVDLILLMSVNPGFGGQKFIPYTLDKVRALRQYFDGKGLSTDIQVDGGVNRDTIRPLIEAGANVLVAGSAVFGGDVKANVETFMNIFKEYER